MIYIVKADNRVKIGFTSAPESRIRDLQVSNPAVLEVLLVVNGNRDLEQQLHREFQYYRIRGEWFEYCQPIKDLIANSAEDDRKYEFGFEQKDFDSGEQVFRLRKESSLSFRAMGRLLGITPQSAKSIETRELDGTITLKSLEKAFGVLGYKLEYRAMPKKTIGS